MCHPHVSDVAEQVELATGRDAMVMAPDELSRMLIGVSS